MAAGGGLDLGLALAEAGCGRASAAGVKCSGLLEIRPLAVPSAWDGLPLRRRPAGKSSRPSKETAHG